MSSSNIQAVTKTVDAHAVAGRTRVAGIYFTNTATAGGRSVRDAARPCNIARDVTCDVARKIANKTIGGRDWAGEGG